MALLSILKGSGQPRPVTPPDISKQAETQAGWKRKLLGAELELLLPALCLDGRLLVSARGELVKLYSSPGTGLLPQDRRSL